MAARRARLVVERYATPALVLRVVPYGEADAVVTFFGETTGRVSAMARGARKASKSRPQIDSMHTLLITLEERPGAELMTLRSSELSTLRLRLTGRLDALEAAGRALRWLRAVMPARHADPGVWVTISWLLDELDVPGPLNETALLATAGLRLLDALGWGFDLDQCIVCGKACPPAQSGLLDPARGGLVCRACGGASSLVRASLRDDARAAAAGTRTIAAHDADQVLAWVEAGLAAHGGVVG